MAPGRNLGNTKRKEVAKFNVSHARIYSTCKGADPSAYPKSIATNIHKYTRRTPQRIPLLWFVLFF